MKLIEAIRQRARALMRHLARGLNALTGGKLHPDLVTLIGFAMHIPIAVLIGLGHYNLWAAVLLFIFGLFDTLDGELARLQGRESSRGGLLDASTDRMKEVLLYIGAAYAATHTTNPGTAVWAVAACGASLCVSYVKAKGEAIVAADKGVRYAALNKLFKDGLLTFEVRMFVLLAGLVTGRVMLAVALIAVLATYTAFQRLIRISRAL